MNKVYVHNAFSPSMIGDGVTCSICEITETEFQSAIHQNDIVSIVSHKETADVLSEKFGKEIAFNRQNVTMKKGDVLYCAIPQIRFEQTKEFGDLVKSASFRFFKVNAH